MNEMNHALSAATESQRIDAQKSLQATERRKLVMVTLWQRMREMFGNVWELNYGTADGKSIETWAAGLADYSENQIRKGVKQRSKWDKPFPPNLGQFARLCLIKSYQPPTPPSKVKSLQDLTKTRPGDTAIAKRERARVAKILRGEDVETKEESMEVLKLHARWGA